MSIACTFDWSWQGRNALYRKKLHGLIANDLPTQERWLIAIDQGELVRGIGQKMRALNRVLQQNAPPTNEGARAGAR